MSSKRCARCEKTVYPLEELKCLDKIWHKLCFKCQECGMTLNMKTYKGFNKLPYCNAHCPQAKHTAVADTPEIRRLAENTKLQSNVKYHEDFEKQKGKVTQVADDPETVRIRNTSKIISNVAYHGDLEKKKQMEQKRHLVPEKNGIPHPVTNAATASPPSPSPQPPMSPSGKIADYDPMIPPEAHESPYSSKLSSTVIYTSQEGPDSQDMGGMMRPAGTFRAMYDYSAQDSDEVSFKDGDVIINCVSIDKGWMTGTVKRTGQNGMLPANYVEPIN
ncbi:LIM and SH3 domain protein F42H10.3 isoform X3 [Centruroides vittatus]|uniref:LIM and SH3 domain protein F42H10.3 isoform X3 n=1 Tax=Centruroides vittatus TaxID=120091 RepID=UPI0035109C02